MGADGDRLADGSAIAIIVKVFIYYPEFTFTPYLPIESQRVQSEREGRQFPRKTAEA